MEFNLHGRQCFIRGSVALALADNPASQALGGYKALASALRKCRHCLAIDEEVQTKVYPKVHGACLIQFDYNTYILPQFTAEELQACTRETHHHHCSLLKSVLHNHISTTFGLTRDAILNTLRYIVMSQVFSHYVAFL